MTEQQVKQEALRIVEKYLIKLIIKTVGYIDYENAAKQCAILEVQSNIDLLDMLCDKMHHNSILTKELNKLKQIKSEIDDVSNNEVTTCDNPNCDEGIVDRDYYGKPIFCQVCEQSDC